MLTFDRCQQTTGVFMPIIPASSTSTSFAHDNFTQAQISIQTSGFTTSQKQGLVSVLDGYRNHPNPDMRQLPFNSNIRPLETTELTGYATNQYPKIKVDGVIAQLPSGEQVTNATVTSNGQDEKITTLLTSSQHQQLHTLSAQNA